MPEGVCPGCRKMSLNSEFGEVIDMVYVFDAPILRGVGRDWSIVAHKTISYVGGRPSEDDAIESTQ